MTDVGPDKDRPTLIFATLNPGKVGEMNDLLLDTPWGVAPMPDDMPEYEETGTTFAENARGKALFTSRRVAVPVLADDSGLEVEALGGEPGVRSARYIDPSISQEARNGKIIDMLEGIGAAHRGARFVCHLALAYHGKLVHETTGTCCGRITESPAGDGGFGYDPVFLVPELGRTFAQLSREEKSTRSHRGVAARDMAAFLRAWRADQPEPATC